MGDMRKKGVMILGAGVMQVPMIKKAKDMGLFVIASDRNSWAEGFFDADVSVTLDIKNADEHVKWALRNNEVYNISGVIAGADVAITAASVSNALGLPGIPVEVAERSNNKSLMKERWLKDGVPTPWAEEVTTLQEAKAAIRKTGLPCMVKAIDNAASRGSRRIDSIDDLEEALADASAHSTTGTALIEEFVEGPEQSVELIVWNNRHYRFGIVDRHFGFGQFPIETGHTNPSALPPDVQESLYRVVEDAATSLGIDFGPYKADTILTKKGPMVLELPARLSGGFHSQYTTPLATGLEPQKMALALATGLELKEEYHTATRKNVTVCRAVFPDPGVVKLISGVEVARAMPGVDQVFMMVNEGDVIPEYRNCGHRVCYIIATGKDAAEAGFNWHRGASAVRINTTPEKKYA